MLKSERIYSPQISLESYKLLKRFSWFENQPMTRTLDSIIYQALELVSPAALCQSCRANKSECKLCIIFTRF